MNTILKYKNIALSNKQIKLVPLSSIYLEKSMVWANDVTLHPLILRNSPVNRETHLKWHDDLMKSSDKIVFAIIENYHGYHIGNTGFYHISEEHKRAEFWILIGEKSEWRKGIGKAALSLMLKFGFRDLQLNKAYLMVSEQNAGAINLYQSMGFHQDGILREHFIIHGEKHNVIAMSILREEFLNEL